MWVSAVALAPTAALELESMNMLNRSLTPRQVDALLVVGQRAPVSARDVAYSLLSTDTAERARLDGLSRRGLVDRQYTGLRHGDRVGYVLTTKGAAALDGLALPENYEPGMEDS